MRVRLMESQNRLHLIKIRMHGKPNLIVDLTFTFSLKIIKFSEELQALKKFNMANQLFRSGTSIGANVREAQGAESKLDFKHKCKVAYKEAEETEYWLDLCKGADSYPESLVLNEEIRVIKRVLGKIISTSAQ